MSHHQKVHERSRSQCVRPEPLGCSLCRWRCVSHGVFERPGPRVENPPTRLLVGQMAHVVDQAQAWALEAGVDQGRPGRARRGPQRHGFCWCRT